MQGHFQHNAALGRAGYHAGFHRCQPVAFGQSHAAAEQGQSVGDGVLAVFRAYHHAVDLGQVPARMGEPVGQFAVVSEQDEPFGKIVQPPHGVEAFAPPRVGHEVEHGLAAFGVVGGGDYLHRLMQHEPAGLSAFLPQHHRAAVQGHFVAGHDAHAGAVGRLAVHTHCAGKDKFVGFAAGAYARIGKSLVESDSLCHAVLADLFMV